MQKTRKNRFTGQQHTNAQSKESTDTALARGESSELLHWGQLAAMVSSSKYEQ
jgi:hypothetical protein